VHGKGLLVEGFGLKYPGECDAKGGRVIGVPGYPSAGLTYRGGGAADRCGAYVQGAGRRDGCRGLNLRGLNRVKQFRLSKYRGVGDVAAEDVVDVKLAPVLVMLDGLIHDKGDEGDDLPAVKPGVVPGDCRVTGPFPLTFPTACDRASPGVCTTGQGVADGG